MGALGNVDGSKQRWSSIDIIMLGLDRYSLNR